MSLTPYLQTVARGKTRGRALSFDEAKAAMTLMLTGEAQPEVTTALLMVLRVRGETPEEIAGFTAALRDSTAVLHGAFDLDWPCYAAGRARGAPLFLLAAKLVTHAGHRVLLHGWNSHQGSNASIRAQLDQLNIPLEDQSAPITYMPLETLSPKALELLRLREVLGLRSCVNTVLRMWNPSDARASVQGVFHPVYRGLQAEAAKVLGQTSLTVIKGGGGEFERNPGKAAALFGLRKGDFLKDQAPELMPEAQRLLNPDTHYDPQRVWLGQDQDAFAVQTVIGTAALALWTLDDGLSVAEAEAQAKALWDARHDQERQSA
ncbi:MAG: glycosyl transferase family protein [Pseudomonadota bacterium]